MVPLDKTNEVISFDAVSNFDVLVAKTVII